jgi:hypothetical protein
MKIQRLFFALALLYPATAFAQTVTTPSGTTTLKAADDFATRAFQDPWDMNQKTDVGPFLGSNDASSNGWAPGFTFAGGLFSGTTTAGDAQLWLLDTGNPLAAPLGKTGTNFPIDTAAYKVFAVRMKVQSGGSQAFVYSWSSSIYQSSPQVIVGKVAQAGWNVYLMNLGADASWTGLRRAFRFDPVEGKTNESVQVDWARLVTIDPSLCQPITWTGAATADIYLDNDTDPTNHLGLIQGFASAGGGTAPVANQASPGCPVVAGAYNFYTGALPAGTYKVFIVGTVGAAPTVSNAKYAPGSWTVNDIPTLKFTSPTDEGSADDFAASQLGDAWDFNTLADIDTLYNVTSPSIATLNMEAPDGSALPNQRVFQGTSVAAAGGCQAIGDPVMVMLDFAKRGKTVLIDTNRYRLLTVEFGIPNAPRDVNCGSIARVVWHKKGDDVTSGYSVSDDLIFNSRAGVNLLDKLTVDLKTLKVEQGVGAPGVDWNNGPGGGVDFFRFDPHEFGPATPFYVKRIKLADYERAKTSYTITWTYSKSVGTVDLYYDLDNVGFDGTNIATGIDATLGQYTWSIPGNLPTAAGTPVYIYAIFRDSIGSTGNSNQVYAPLPIVMDSNFTQKGRLVLSRRTLNFGALANTPTATTAQTVRLTFVGPYQVTPCWTITNSNLNFSVTPSSGTGNATVTVALVPQTFPGGGVGVATFTVNECGTASTFLNPGQQFTATYRITTGGLPVGTVDTPADNITGVSGSLGVTGWVVDDINITGVRIYRNAVSGETGDGLGRIFLGDANRVDDARPDIEAAYPTSPFNYRGGWGYLLLTNFLPGLGNGTFVLKVYATDADGHEVFLGQRTITCTNSSATDPFGAIDTPGQGATVSGNLNNFGWVLARGPARADPPGGGTVTVVVDGALIGNPGQWTSRSDLTGLFPASTYPGISTALGVFTFNTAVYQDGVHTISWLVVANTTQAAGIGSRYFTTVNGNNLTLSDTTPNVVSAAALVNPPAHLGQSPRDITSLDRSTRVRSGRGPALRAASPASPDPTGLRTIYGRVMERLVVDASSAGSHQYEAYQVVAGILRPLPIGASFDQRRGILYWQPGVGYTGGYDFLMVRDGQARIPVRVVLTPEVSRTPGNRLFRGLFATD